MDDCSWLSSLTQNTKVAAHDGSCWLPALVQKLRRQKALIRYIGWDGDDEWLPKRLDRIRPIESFDKLTPKPLYGARVKVAYKQDSRIQECLGTVTSVHGSKVHICYDAGHERDCIDWSDPQQRGVVTVVGRVNGESTCNASTVVAGELERLKQQYSFVSGGAPRGPHVNKASWLQMKIVQLVAVQNTQQLPISKHQGEASAVVPQIAGPRHVQAGDQILYKFLLNDCDPDEREQWFIGTVRKTGKELVRCCYTMNTCLWDRLQTPALLFTSRSVCNVLFGLISVVTGAQLVDGQADRRAWN